MQSHEYIPRLGFCFVGGMFYMHGSIISTYVNFQSSGTSLLSWVHLCKSTPLCKSRFPLPLQLFLYAAIFSKHCISALIMNVRLHFENSSKKRCYGPNSALCGCMHGSIGLYSEPPSKFLRETLHIGIFVVYRYHELVCIIYR